MMWSILIPFLTLTSARNVENVNPEYLEALRSSGQDEEFARLLGVDVSLIRPDSEQRSEGSRYNFASPLGDILLTEEQERQGMNFNSNPKRKWPDGKIPYYISSDFNRKEKKMMVSAMNDFNEKVTNVQLVPYRGETNYVYVQSGNGCWSYMGCTGGQQPLSLQKDGCLTNGTVQHEFIHAAGCAHEHTRTDREKYVKILWENISDDWQSQYEKCNEDSFSNIGNYDYDSVMHYPIWSPSNSQYDAFELPRGIDRNRLGQDRGVSKMDVDKLNYLYS